MNRMNEMGKYFLISLSVFLMIMIFSAVYFGGKMERLEYSESPIEKIETLKVIPKETYSYTYSSDGGDMNLTYITFKGRDCTGVFIDEIPDAVTCLDKYGNDINNSNITLSNPLFYFFRPWMLSVDDNWEWNATMVMNADGMFVPMSVLEFKTEKTEIINGREAYKVIMREGNKEAYVWVDKEKRVLLKETGLNYKIELVSSPFLEEQ